MGPGSTYRVLPYSFDDLVELLAEFSNKDAVLQKTHSVYFEGYFKQLEAKTIVVENEYIDHDYLEDFTAYYVKCFHEYGRSTRRLHFFSIAFDSAGFTSVLRGEDNALHQALLQSYLGFIVVKPLPQTVVGRTCLRTYPTDNDRRHYPILQDYEANLFGIGLTVRTLAFQEQDSVVAACATSALWSAFQGTGQLFHHRIPSPAEITRVASDHIPDEHPQVLPETRGMPNKGLTPTQMAHGIRSVGLEPYLVGASDDNILRATLYAYLRSGIPIILVFALLEVDRTTGKRKVIGRHGVAVTGYSLGSLSPQVVKNTNVRLRAIRIDKIYVHDDQIGPFARMGLQPDGTLDTSWFARQGRCVVAQPQFLLIPLYHKIRIPFGCVQDAILEVGGLVEAILSRAGVQGGKTIEWDIYLTTVNSLKTDLLACSTLGALDKEKILTCHLPKYIWRSSVYLDGVHELDLLMDATDIEQGGAFIASVEHGKNISGLLKLFVKHFGVPKSSPISSSIYRHFAC